MHLLSTSRFICLFFFILALSSCSTEATPSLLGRADKILVLKSKRQLHLLQGKNTLKVYKIALGRNPIGHKEMEGDNKTPEGRYEIVQHNPRSQFYKSLRISYPNELDRKNASAIGKSPGSDIMIHGLGKAFAFLGKAHILHDWTLGCIAVTNDEIDEIYSAVPDKTPIEIKP